jgi:SpoVK/Ycf46/Vps4 family AAA+-type ATPase
MPVALLETSVGVLRPVLNPRVQSQVDSIVAERRDHEKLAKVGLRPTATVLVSGPPGVGKTMCARYLAAELGVPLLTVDLASVMSSYLGKTGQNLRAALDFGRTRECLLFLDEFDALAKRRDDESDIGELKRIVNVLLLELERWPSTSLLVAATNHPQLLDRAVSRRFDALIEIDLPGFAERLDIVHQILDMKGLEEAPSAAEIAALCTDGCSGSELTRIIDTALRRSALTDEPLLDSTVRALLEHYPVSQTSEARDKLCLLAADRLHWSNRRIANFLGVSHPTVAKILQRVRGDRNGH